MADQAERALDDARDVESSVHDPARFTAVFDRYFAEIHGYAARRLGPDAADDIAADTFTTAEQEFVEACGNVVANYLGRG